MKYIIILAMTSLASCSVYDAELVAHLDAERDFAYHQYHGPETTGAQYDPEHLDDCLYYKELVCEFE
jgi:hypothetical protein